LGRNGLSGRSNLSINWQPLGVTDGTRRSQIAAQRCGQFFGQREIVFALDAATDRDDDVRLTEIDSLLGLLERRLGFHASLTHLDGFFLYPRAASLHRLITAKRARLKSGERWWLAL